MRRGGAGKRRDAIEPDVIDALEDVGARVIRLSGAAPVPDLLVGFRGRWYAAEVKTGPRATLTKNQREEWADGKMSPTIIRNINDALSMIGLLD